MVRSKSPRIPDIRIFYPKINIPRIKEQRIPEIRIPKIDIPKELKLDFQREFEKLKKEQKRGIRGNKYGRPF